jgi:hypothetical protein
MWIATRHGGVARYDRGGIRSVSLKDGLLSNTVWWMTEDAFGSIWIGTQMGMQRIDKNSLSLFPVVKDLLGDGIICCGVSRDSIVWSYQPKRFTIHEHLTGAAHPVPPLVNITKFQVNGADVDLERPHEFRYDENVCTIEYIGINFRDEKAVRYQYRLTGAGPEWHPSTDHHAVTFATLNPGSYVFEVRAISGEGVYSTDASSLAFTIVPPFWQQWWFRVLAASCLAGLFFFFYRYRMAKVLEIERTRNRIARDLHDEVGGTLSSISYFAEALHAETKKQGLPRNEQLLSLIRESTASAKASMSDIAWSLDPSNDSWEKLLSKMRRYAADLLEARSIRHSISIPATVPATTLSMEARQNIWLLFKEMIVNAVKHSGCTEIGISLRIENNLLILTVADNGLGFDANAVTDGRGVRNIRERAALLGGELRLETSRGNGTCWELVKPM